MTTTAYLLIAIVAGPYSPGNEQLELVDSITNRNECLHLAHEFRKEDAFKGVTFKCIRSTESTGTLVMRK
jgi:hypothetical protein